MNITNDSYESLVIGGEEEIRTLETRYGLRDFQSRALDQLRDFSKVVFGAVSDSLDIIPQYFYKINTKIDFFENREEFAIYGAR